MPATVLGSRPEELTARLCVAGGTSSAGGEEILRALREVKNQIIGNKTKKLLYLGLGAVPRIVAVLESAICSGDTALVVQSSAAIGSFACGVEDGVRSVVDAGAVPVLIRTLSFTIEKVVDAGARSLRMIFQSKLAPKYDIFREENLRFLYSLLNSENENAIELASCIIAHSCENNKEQEALCEAGVLVRLFSLLEGSSNRKDVTLDAIAAIVKNNSEIATRFACIGNGKAMSSLFELLKDRFPRTRLHACACLSSVIHVAPPYLEDLQIKTKMTNILLELLEEPGQVGDDAPFALANLISGEEELKKHPVSVSAVVKICNILQNNMINTRRLWGILHALAELCSKSDKCRCELMSLKVLDLIAETLKHESADVQIAACNCIKSLSRSVKNLSAGSLSIEAIVCPLVQLLHSSSLSIQVAAIEAISNVAVDFTRKSCFIESGGVKQLVHLSKSMDPTLRLKAVWALRNMMFVSNFIVKESILMELTVATLTSLICDSETSIQEQALALIRNLVDGLTDTVDLAFSEDGLIVNAVARQLRSTCSLEVCIQGMLFLCNVSAGNDFHKEGLLTCLLPLEEKGQPPFIVRFLQSKNAQLRTAALWCVINLTYPGCLNLSRRIERLRDAGIITILKTMINDPHLDTKFRVRTALEQCMNFDSSST